MIFLLNLIGFLIEMIICPILMIPFFLWRLLVSIQFSSPEKEESEEEIVTTHQTEVLPNLSSYQLLQKAS